MSRIMNLLISKKTLALLVVVALVTTVMTISMKETTMASDIVDSVSKIEQEIDEAVKENPEVGLSSNPYDYLQYSQEYELLVAKGIPALPAIIKLIEESPNNGLHEYILAIAGEEISKADMRKLVLKEKGQDWGWANSKEWLTEFGTFVTEIPDRYEKIMQNTEFTTEQRNKELEELGVMVIPMMLESFSDDVTLVESLMPVYMNLTDNSVDINLFSKTENIGVQSVEDNSTKTWIESESEKYEVLLDLLKSF